MFDEEFNPPPSWKPLEFGRYRKLASALFLALAEGVALWADAPAWISGAILALIPILVARVPNER